MTVRLVPARSPAAIPAYTLWTLHKDGQTVEARTRLVPIGTELRIYMSNSPRVRPDDLLWSMILRDGREVNELAREKQREFEVQGWRTRAGG